MRSRFGVHAVVVLCVAIPTVAREPEGRFGRHQHPGFRVLGRRAIGLLEWDKADRRVKVVLALGSQDGP